ncbi:hypothetical protein GCM10009657_41400 [Oryzihumus leptocrescens]
MLKDANPHRAGSVPSHRLLPHEKAWVGYVARRQAATPNATYQRLLSKYGPEGARLLIAGYVTSVPCGALVLAGIILLIASGGGVGLLRVGGAAMAVGCAGQILPFLRAWQCSVAGRRFRAGVAHTVDAP